MDVYLMQHGVAESESVNPLRPLTETGRREVIEVGTLAGRRGVQVDRIVHSDKLRAVQTAVELGRCLGCGDVSAEPGLHPGDPVEPAAERWADPKAEGSVILVGHLPFVERLASQLVTGNPSAKVISFRNGALVALRPANTPGGYAIAWILTPELAAREA
jgi:phosphohistidine phosphatase